MVDPLLVMGRHNFARTLSLRRPTPRLKVCITSPCCHDFCATSHRYCLYVASCLCDAGVVTVAFLSVVTVSSLCHFGPSASALESFFPPARPGGDKGLPWVGGVALPFVFWGIVPMALCMWSFPNVTRSIKRVWSQCRYQWDYSNPVCCCRAFSCVLLAV